MNPPEASPEPDWLLQQTSWIRGLALSLVGDATRAEDLVQDTLVAALAHGPPIERCSPSWFSTVVRNLARKSARRPRARRAPSRDQARQCR